MTRGYTLNIQYIYACMYVCMYIGYACTYVLVFMYVRINLPLFSTVVPSIICMFLSCRPFVVTTLSTGLVGVEVTSVSWLGQLTAGV